MMKTTLELPDELMSEVRVRAAKEGRKLKDLVAELIRSGLEQETRPGGAPGPRPALPLIECAHRASPGEEMTADRVAQVLSDQDVGALSTH